MSAFSEINHLAYFTEKLKKKKEDLSTIKIGCIFVLP
jgi:hypothetical protein